MVNGVDGFVLRHDTGERRPARRRWPDHVKAQIVAESFQPGVRVVVLGHGYETAHCAGYAANLNSVAASVSRAFCSARI